MNRLEGSLQVHDNGLIENRDIPRAKGRLKIGKAAGTGGVTAEMQIFFFFNEERD